MPESVNLRTDREPGDYVEARDINQIAQAVNHLASGGGGGGGVTAHGDLTGRSDPNQHPIGAITGLTATLANKSDADHQHTSAQISDATTTGRVLMQASSAIAARTSIGAASSTHTHDNRYYTEDEVDAALAGKANTGHEHTIRDVEYLQIALNSKAENVHQHPVSDLTTTGTADETTFLRGDGAWATPAGGGGGGGLRFIKPAVSHYFTSPLLYGGVEDKPKGHIGPTYYPGYATPLTVSEVSIWVNVAGSSGHTAEVVVYEATSDGLLGDVITTTTHDVSSTGRQGVAITPFVWPEHGVWTMVNLSESGARLRVAGFAPLGTTGSGQGSNPAFNLLQAAVTDPNNGNAGNPGIVAFRRTA